MTETLSKDLAGLVERWRDEHAAFVKIGGEPEHDDHATCADELSALLAQHAVAEPQRCKTCGGGGSVGQADEGSFAACPDCTPAHAAEQRMGTGAPAVLLQKIEAILGRCVFDQPDSLTYDEGVKLVRELVAMAHAAEQPKLTEDGMYWIAFGKFLTARFGGELPADNEHGRFWEAASNLLASPVVPAPPKSDEQIIEIDEDGKVHGDISGLKKGDQ